MTMEKLTRILFVATLIVTSFSCAGGPFDKTAPARPPASTAGSPAPTVGPDASPITQAAAKAGVISCDGRINQVSNFLTSGAEKTGFFEFIPPTKPDQNIFSVSMELQGKDGAFAYASASFAPNQADGCGALYEQVAYWPMSCTEVAQKLFSGMAREGELLKNITVLVGPPTVRVFLMPAGAGCTSIKKEVVR
jgi:hypothetical protein